MVLAILAGFLLYFVLWGGLPFGLGFLTGRFTGKSVVALRDTIRITDSVIVVRDSIVYRYKQRLEPIKAKSDALDSVVVLLNTDSAVVVHDSLFVVPPEVVQDIRALRITVSTQDTLIRHLYGRDSTQEWRIATRDKMIRELSRKNPFACGRKCGFVLGVGASVLVYKAVK